VGINDGLWTRRQTLAALGAFVIVGCSSDNTDTTSSSPAITAASDTPMSTALAGQATNPADGPVSIEHTDGTTTLDAIPSRVVILDDAMLGDLLPFGVIPVGTAAGIADPTVIAVWQDEAGVSSIENVAPDFTPNLESIARVEPDLILAMAFQSAEPFYDELKRLAPVIAVETDVNPAVLEPRFDEVSLRTYSQIFRQPQVADELLAAYQARIDELRAEFGPVIDGRTISFATSMFTPGQVSIDGPTGWAGAILNDLGFRFPAEQLTAMEANVEFPIRHEFSNEETERFLSSDVVIWRDARPGDLEVIRGFDTADVETNPLLSKLPSVANDAVFTVNNRTWFLRSVRGRMKVLDQLATDILVNLPSR
jgi:ABC-type Fe3+-hydroxamate transport system substrate-binding protein